MEGKANKHGPKKNTGRGKNNAKRQYGPVIGNGEHKEQTMVSPKLGSWTRLHVGPKTQGRMEVIEVEDGPKRKCDGITFENTCMGKKQRLDVETKNLSILLATHLGLAEAAEQLRQDQ